MTEPIPSLVLTPLSRSEGALALGKPAEATPTSNFRDVLLDSLEEVNRLQSEADAGVQRLVTGETDNVAEVLLAVNKAGIAFDLLMEIRNKLSDAYKEIQQMRV